MTDIHVNQTTRDAEQERIGSLMGAGGFPRVPPHDEPESAREAWLRGYDLQRLKEWTA